MARLPYRHVVLPAHLRGGSIYRTVAHQTLYLLWVMNEGDTYVGRLLINTTHTLGLSDAKNPVEHFFFAMHIAVQQKGGHIL